MTVGWVAESDEDIAAARAIFERIAPTLQLVQPFEETAEPVTPFNDGGSEPPSDPVALPEGWPAELTDLFTPLEPGEYSALGFGTAFSFSLSELWWVQPNFPGWLALTGDESFGPGDRDVVVRVGATSLVPIIRGEAAGDALPLDPRAMSENPPQRITILDSGEVAVGGVTGYRVRFEFDPATDCAAGEVCEYWLTTRDSFPASSMRIGYLHEIWHLDGLDEPITIVVSGFNQEWFDRVQRVFDTFQFDL